MTVAIALLLAVIIIAAVCFALEWVSPDVVAIGVILALVLTGILPPERAFAGFGSGTVMLILGLLFLTAALQRTGVVDLAGRALARRTGDDPNRLLLIVMVVCAVLSAFMSNTAATALFMPIVFGIARNAKISASKLLMPVAFASILTSSVTLISTSSNMVVSGVMEQSGLPALRMFELAPVGLPIAVAGIAYMYFIGRRLIPERATTGEEIEQFGLRPYLSEVVVLPTSQLVGKTLGEARIGQQFGLRVLRIVRDKDRMLAPGANTRLLAGDVLIVEGSSEDILKIKDVAGIDIKADVKFTDPDLQSEDTGLVEVILLPRAALIGRTLKGFGFSERFDLQVLALNRPGGIVQRKISQIRLRMGDVLLVQGRIGAIAALQRNRTFRILGQVDGERANTKRAGVAILIFAGVIASASLGLVALPVAALLGAFLAFVTKCITPEEAYRDIEWKVVILIGCMLALGTAMTETGTDRYLAGLVVSGLGGLGPLALLAGFFVLTVILTQPMSNQAAAVVVLPVAIQTAIQLNLNPRTFAVTVAVAATCSYLTPLEPCCLMVYGPGRYRFADFLKAGGLLTLVIFAIAMALIPLRWPVSVQ